MYKNPHAHIPSHAATSPPPQQYKQQLYSRLHPGKDSGVPALPAEEHAALEREYQQMSRHLSGLKKVRRKKMPKCPPFQRVIRV